jgi:hypothetical protein
MTTGAIILFGLAIVSIIIDIILTIYTKVGEYLFLLILALIFFILGLAVQNPPPTNKDVKEGKAHYIEQNHTEVVNGDTVNTYKTYRIEWNQNTK